jgi:hypothetical protein
MRKVFTLNVFSYFVWTLLGSSLHLLNRLFFLLNVNFKVYRQSDNNCHWWTTVSLTPVANLPTVSSVHLELRIFLCFEKIWNSRGPGKDDSWINPKSKIFSIVPLSLRYSSYLREEFQYTLYNIHVWYTCAPNSRRSINISKFRRNSSLYVKFRLHLE